MSDDEADAVLAAGRVLVAISARSLDESAERLDLTQFRILTAVGGGAGMSLGEVCDVAGLHPSRASRICDRLVVDGLLNRTDDPQDRRQLVLTLTGKGRRLVERVLHRRRESATAVLAGLAPTRRRVVVDALREFAEAGAELGRPTRVDH